MDSFGLFIEYNCAEKVLVENQFLILFPNFLDFRNS